MRFLAVVLFAQAFLGDSGGVRVVGEAGRPPPATYCGRKCNCGIGVPQTVETEDGKRVEGTTPPDGQHCTCAEVYRCKASDVPALAPPACPRWTPGNIVTIPASGGQ